MGKLILRAGANLVALPGNHPILATAHLLYLLLSYAGTPHLRSQARTDVAKRSFSARLRADKDLVLI